MMTVMRSVLSIAAIVIATATARIADGQGAGSGSGSGSGGEIEMEGDKPPDKPAEPDQPVKDPKLVKKWLAAAQQLVTRGDALAKAGKADEAKDQYTNAALAFTRAIEAGGDASTYLPLALVEDKLGDVLAAHKHLKLVIDPAAAQKPDVVKKAQAKLEELAGKLGVVKLVVNPEGTQITIGRNSIGESPLPAPIVLAPGTYTVSFAAVGFQPKDVELKVEAGSESERTIELERVPITIKPIEPDVPEPAKKPDPLPLYIGAGATGLLFVVSTITGIAAVAQHNTYVARKSSASQRDDARTAGRNLAHATDACLVGTLGAAAFTAYWYWYKYRPAHHNFEKNPPASPPKVTAVPWVQGSGGGVLAVGSF